MNKRAVQSASAEMAIPTHGGTYVLVLACHRAGRLPVGRLGMVPLQPGFYAYVGSAFGPGGLAARLQHHRQRAARPHWHIDYLRAECDLVAVWLTTDATRREHSWAGVLAGLPGADMPTPGFGSSDCDCETHLFRFERRPSFAAFRPRVKTPILRIGLAAFNARP